MSVNLSFVNEEQKLGMGMDLTFGSIYILGLSVLESLLTESFSVLELKIMKESTV